MSIVKSILKYFSSIEKKKKTFKTVCELIDDPGNHLSTAHQTFKMNKTVFFTKRNIFVKVETNNNFLTTIFFNHSVKFPQPISESYERKLTFEEYSKEFKNMSNERSEDSDRFTFEFFRVIFGRILAYFMYLFIAFLSMAKKLIVFQTFSTRV